MGKSARKKNKKNDSKNKEAVVTMEALRELSDEEELPSESEWDDKAKALKDAIESGKFDQALAKAGDDEADFEEATLDDSEDEATSQAGGEKEEAEEQKDNKSDSESEDESEEEEDRKVDDVDRRVSSKQIKSVGEDADEDTSEEEDEDEEIPDDDEEESDHAKAPIRPSPDQRNSFHAKALRILTEELESKTKAWPWAETFDIMPQDPLPFDHDVSIHDDLKREVSFYDIALKAALLAKNNCKDAKIPFSRPDDFFAEMVKSDQHMARVKDALIFQTKKMDAVSQRKANKEQKLRAKESKSNKLAEKAKRKKDHFRAIEEWAETAKSNRGQSLDDRENMDSFFHQRKSKKREYADKKFGHGGRRGRFKQNDPSALNDMSSYNPRGNFEGAGTKFSGKRKKNGAGANRPGKRSRDAKRSAAR